MQQLELRKNQGNELAYVSIVEPRVSGNGDVELFGNKSNNELIKNWSGKLVRTGGYATNFDVTNPLAIKSNNIIKDDNGEIMHYSV